MKAIYFPNNNFAGWNEKTIEELATEKGLSQGDIISQIVKERDRQLAAWREAAIGRAFNHYIRLGFKVTY